ncbi:sensor histidine kinase [Xylophilus ampelinus]|uniref:histidine kinase n=1 Tax=Xylophilus ampelinus TaxID=54067 RepID=A0A318SLI2_9BURK|nr:ATP-binding protein [Xylophilus ampelinus]MCS4510277.1 ATP-binding protein [Xylophilus ampelinus]PYE78102.1 nitrogen fixation/metabolism regulation signal transduction histidine kinase [Xylophilus ampelinus]
MSSTRRTAHHDDPRYSLLHSRAARWAVGIGVATMVSIGLVLLFLLTQATNNRALYERNYGFLFTVNVVVAGLLLAVIAWIGMRLYGRLRRGRFGSRLLMKLAIIFAVLGFLPGMLIYTVSYQFVSRSIESWFDVKVEGALDAGLSLGRSTLDALSNDLVAKTRTASALIANLPDAAAGLALERIRDQIGASDVVLWNSQGHLIASAGQSRFQLNPDRPAPQLLRNVRGQRTASQIEGLDDLGPNAGISGARVKAIVLVSGTGVELSPETRFLQATQPLPPTLVANAVAVQEAYREYQERALAREGLRRMYIGTLTLSLFLAVFGAMLLAVLLGNQLARPLLVLAEGVREVAAGDLSPKAALQGKDELGGLTRAFADMTQQLSEARSAVDKSMLQVDTARANLQTILDNLTAGVIVLDADGRILSSNRGATRILRAPLAACEGQLLAEVAGLADFGKGVQAQFHSFLGDREQHGIDHWQQSFELHAGATGPQQDATTVIARGAELPGTARLLVFDDISEIVSAQRAQAWGEVARRLAHEIKNPLTPIQLSAERLAMKLDGKVDAAGQAVLTKSVRTIVEQVDAMKRLVNEFRDYARLPAAELAPVDLNALVADILHLYENDGGSGVRVRAELDPQCSLVLGDGQQLRQVVHNLVQNAQDATDAAQRSPAPPVVIRTRQSETTGRVRLTVIDSGTGFSESLLKRAFEPYVTTKSKGTGLGLAVVRKIADEHGARVDIANRVEEGETVGAQVSLSLPLAPVAV